MTPIIPIITHTRPLAQWQALIKEAQSTILIHLEEEIESYLVFLLMRFTDKPEIASCVLGLDFLNCYSNENHHDIRAEQLQAVGDHCLLLSGLFPGRAQKRGSQLSYIIKLGQTAYLTLAQSGNSAENKNRQLYYNLSVAFTAMLDILLSIQAKNNALDLFQAIDLWQNANSQSAYQRLQQATSVDPALIPILLSPKKKWNN